MFLALTLQYLKLTELATAPRFELSVPRFFFILYLGKPIFLFSAPLWSLASVRRLLSSLDARSEEERIGLDV